MTLLEKELGILLLDRERYRPVLTCAGEYFINVNGAELLTIKEYIDIANEVTRHNVQYEEISDEELYDFMLYCYYSNI